MAEISAIPQQPQLGRLAQFLRYLETEKPEFLPSQLDVMGLVRQLTLPQASTVENLSYGNLPFTMPPSGTGAMIPQVKTGRKAEVADLVGMLGGVPGGRAVMDVGTKLSNEAADAIVRAITRNPAATAPQVIQETAMPFMQAVAPRAPGLLETPAKSDLGFYSALEQATMPLQNKGTGAQFLAQIEKTAGVKPEEVKWTGLDEFLKSRQNVTKQEIQDYLAANRVDVQEVQLGGPQGFDANRLSQLEDEFAKLKQHPIDDPSFGEEKYDEMIRLMNIRDQSTTSDLYRQADEAMKLAQRAQARGYQETANNFFRQYELLNTRAEKLDLQSMGMDNPPKFSQYTLPGGENYREILLTLPQKVEKGFMTPNGAFFSEADLADPIVRSTAEKIGLSPAFRNVGDAYRSTHFDQPNILAHMRVNDRVVDGKKTLFIEEIQSDWHQAGRKRGYKSETLGEKVSDADYRRAAELQRRRDVLGETLTAEESADLNEIMARHTRSVPAAQVPDAPFKTSWHELTLKRAIQEASEKGYDQIAFTTGKTQAERYDLSKQIDEINVVGRIHAGTGELTKSVALDTVDGQSIRLGVSANGLVDNVNKPEMSGLVGKNLDEVVGKELAKKIMEGGSQTISGEGLKVGGEGMKGFYDQILPKTLDKLGKKFDAKVSKTKLPSTQSKDDLAAKVYGRGETYNNLPSELKRKIDQMYIDDGVEVWQMDITPKMRESVLTKGQPLFAATPAIPAAGLLGDENE